MEGGSGSKGGEGFIDRSKVRILLCDNDTKSSEQVFTLLCNCSYQVTSVKSARQLIDALNAEGPDIDIILAEVDLPMAKGMKMLKYITRDKVLQRIPVIMMSALDEVSVVVKCLRLGAADYLVKPLRTNELLNLWTHMWRRRRMLGLAEKNILTCDFDLVASDPSDANTNSITLFSDDTDERFRKTTNLEASLSNHQEHESTAAVAVISAAVAAVTGAVVGPPASMPMEYRPNVPGISDRRTGQFLSGPKKSELKVGESSAFFTYVKSSIVKNNAHGIPHAVMDAAQDLMISEKLLDACGGQDNRDARENHSRGDEFPNSSVPDSNSLERLSSIPPMSQHFPQERNTNEEQTSQVLLHAGSRPQLDLSGFRPQNAYSYYMSGMTNQVTMSSSTQLYQKNPANLAMMSQYNHLSQCGPAPEMASFPYYPVSICLQPGQMPTSYPWPSFGSSSSTVAKSGKVDRREAALIKFRQKRKERCFDKKIRYVNRKKLAERRPRVRGQFVRKVNGVNVDLNGEPASAEFDEDEDYEEQASRDSSPDDDTCGYRC